MKHVNAPTQVAQTVAPDAVLAKLEAARQEAGRYDHLDRWPKRVSRRYQSAVRALISGSEVDLRVIAARVGVFAMELDAVDVHDEDDRRTARSTDELTTELVLDLYEHLEGLLGTSEADVTKFDWVMLCMRAEGLAKKCAELEWRSYAINPEGLVRLIKTLASIQLPLRELAERHAPGAASIAINAVHCGILPFDVAGEGSALPQAPLLAAE